MKRKALVVGIDKYRIVPLSACVGDATRVGDRLASAEFDVQRLTCSDYSVTEKLLRDKIRELFASGGSTIESSILYYAGHGFMSEAGGALAPQDWAPGRAGVAMDEILAFANASSHGNRTIILDCCHSGAFGELANSVTALSTIGRGVTILAASREDEPAKENAQSGGAFTRLLMQGLEGAAADRHGRIFPFGLYMYIADTFGAWDQTPVYKANVEAALPIDSIAPETSARKTLTRSRDRFIKDTEAAAELLSKPEVAGIVDDALQPLLQVRRRFADWAEGSNKWIADFYDHVADYERIHTTDVERRSSLGSPAFERYLRKQYDVRAALMANQGPVTLPVSPELFEAIEKTGWLPDTAHWTVEETPSLPKHATEIVRILIRDSKQTTPDELNALWVLERDHARYGIPLFVLDGAGEFESVPDFAMALDRRGDVTKCFEFNEEMGEVELTSQDRGGQLRDEFSDLLKSERLTLVSEFIGHVMVRDPERSRSFATDYPNRRQASAQVVDLIRDRLQPTPSCVGLDIGCGTGNYLLALADDFIEAIGVDINKPMLDVAQGVAEEAGLSKKLKLLRRDAVSTGLSDETVDCVWSVSTLHYLKRKKQARLFPELFRIMRGGARLFLDVGEFAEQHASLWIKDYFPSLGSRYSHSLHTCDSYRGWLEGAGFVEIDCVGLELGESQDLVLRSGQRDPHVYLEKRFQASVPAFREMPRQELKSGESRLREDIESGAVQEVINAAQRAASMAGDVGFVFGRKP